MLTRPQCQSLVAEILSLTDADDAVVQLSSRWRNHLRFANNQVSTSGIDSDQTVSITLSYGSRTGTATGNQVDSASLAELVQAAEALARVSPEDPEHMPSVARQTYTMVGGWREAPRRDLLQSGVQAILDQAIDRGLVAAGFAVQQRRSQSVGTKNGAFGWHRGSTCQLSTTFRTPAGDGSGWANGAGLAPQDLDWAAIGRRAADKAERSVGAKPLKPGRYVTILEPSAVASMAGLLRNSLDQRRMDEGRSWLSAPDGNNRIGEVLFPPWMSVSSNPTDPRAPGVPFTDDGRAHMPSFWIQAGAVKRLPCSRYWAKLHKRGQQAPPVNWLMSGGEGSTEDLIAKTERGVLVTSLWYIRSVDPQTLLHTGLTRDGLFWVEDGEIRHPLTNMRWNESPLTVFGGTIDAGAPVLAIARKGRGDTVVPPLRTKGFHFTSVSDAI